MKATGDPADTEAEADTDTGEALATCERQLRRAGLPVLIHNYSAAEDVFTRALPFLTAVALVEIGGAVNTDWSVATNVAAFVGGAALLVVSYGLLNRLLGRPFGALPSRVGIPELTAFVLLPALLPAVFGGQLPSAGATVLGNLVLVGVTWLVIGFGLFSIVRWAGARLFAQIAASLTLLVRALPLILFFGLVTFFTTETWQLFATVPTVRYVATVVLFLAVGLLFLVVRLPPSVKDIEREVDLAGVPLRPLERVNLALVILVSEALQILLVTGLVCLFFTIFGALLVDVHVIESWIGSPPNRVFSFDLFGEQVMVSRQLLRAAFGFSAFSGLYYTVAMLVDATYRDEFVTELTAQMRSTFAIRTRYLHLLTETRSETRSEPVG